MIEKRILPSGRVSWRVRYYGPDLRERSRSLRLRRDAEAYDAKMRTERQRGDWIDPRGHSGGMHGHIRPKCATKDLPGMKKARVVWAVVALTWAFVWSRLSESNRRPIHYE